jgi:hypothetical protein
MWKALDAWGDYIGRGYRCGSEQSRGGERVTRTSDQSRSSVATGKSEKE